LRCGRLGVLQDFLDGGFAVEDVPETIFAEADHSEFEGFLAKDEGGGSFGDQFPQRIIDIHKFVEAFSSFVAGVAARSAAGPGVKLSVADFSGPQAHRAEQALAWLVRDLAVRADFPNQTLGEHTFEGGGHEEGFAAHVDQTGNGTGGVVGVKGGENKVPGQGGLDGNTGGFLVPHFPDHDAIRILTEEGAENFTKSQSDGFVDGNLHDAIDIILNRILGREQFAIHGVDFLQASVKRGGFSGTGGTGDDENAVRFADRIQNILEEIARKAELAEIEVNGGAVQHPEDDAFTVDGRQAGDAHVDLAFIDHFHDPAILGDASFGDVKVGHDLDPRDDGIGQVSWWRGHFVEGTIDPVADAEFLFERFKVDVGGAFADGLVKHEVHVADNGSRVGLFGNLIEIEGGITAAGGDDAFEHFADVFTGGGIIFIDERLDFAGFGDDSNDIPAEGEAQIFRHLWVERIDKGYFDAIGAVIDGEGAVETRHAGGNGFHEFDGWIELAEVDVVGADFIGHGGPEFIFVGKYAKADEDFDDVAPGRGHVIDDIFGDISIENPAVDQGIGYLFGFHGGVRAD
jgi:hypothetical protein